MKVIRKHLKLFTICVILLLTTSSIILKYYLNQTKKIEEKEVEEETIFKEEEVISEPKKIHVDIKGAINKPGVYEIEEGKLVIDVINIAEGLKENADTSLINLAKKVTNEMVIIIYTIDEVKKALEESNNKEIIKIIDKKCICPNIKNDGCISNNDNNNEQENEETKTNEENNEEILININIAEKEELEKIPGIGSSKAEAIIKYREENGSFNNIEEIKNVTGIGDSLYEKIKNYITI